MGAGASQEKPTSVETRVHQQLRGGDTSCTDAPAADGTRTPQRTESQFFDDQGSAGLVSSSFEATPQHVPVGTGVWSFEESAGSMSWVPFSEDATQRVEAAFGGSDREVTITIGRHLFTVDLHAKVMKRSGGHTHRIRRTAGKAVAHSPQASGVQQADAVAGGDEVVQRDGVNVRITSGSGLAISLASSVKAHGSMIYCAAFTYDGKSILTAGRDGSTRLWEVDSSYIVTDFDRVEAIVLSCAVSDRKNICATGADDAIARLYTVGKPSPIELHGHRHKVYGCDFSADGKTLLTGAMDHDVRCWDATKAECIHTFANAHAAPVFSVSASNASANVFLSGGDDHKLHMWDMRQPTVSTVFSGHTATLWTCDLRYDDERVVSADMQGRVLLWDPRRPATPLCEVGHHSRGERASSVHSVEFSPDGSRILSCARDSTWRVWSAADGVEQPAPTCGPSAGETPLPHPLATVTAHGGVIFNVTYSPMRSQVLSIGSDSRVRLWNVTGL